MACDLYCCSIVEGFPRVALAAMQKVLVGITKTLEIGTVAFLPGARCAEEVQDNTPRTQK